MVLVVVVGNPGRVHQGQGDARESEHDVKEECVRREDAKVALGGVFGNGKCCSCNFLNRNRVMIDSPK